MSALDSVKVGDTVHVRNEERGRGRKGPFTAYVVTKIGRVWLTAAHANRPSLLHKFRISDGAEDAGGYTPRLYAYADQSIALENDAADEAWATFARSISSCRPSHLSLADIQALAAKVTP